MEKMWIAWSLIAVILTAAAVAVWFSKRRRKAGGWSKTPYEAQEYFLSPAERSFFRVLERLVGEEILICPKPSVREVLKVSAEVVTERQKYFNWISQKHLDFVLCERRTMRILCAVELDDRSHEQKERRQRDAFLDKAFDTAGVALFHVPCRKNYGERELSELYRFLLRCCPQQQEEDWIPVCPDCGVPMVLRTVSKGERKGQQFYGCPNFPECWQTRSL